MTALSLSQIAQESRVDPTQFKSFMFGDIDLGCALIEDVKPGSYTALTIVGPVERGNDGVFYTEG